ncbi:zinc-binding dehydrogenase [Paraburkholderia sp. D1E]
MIDKGRVQVRIADTCAFSALPKALARLEEEHVRGKIVVLGPNKR